MSGLKSGRSEMGSEPPRLLPILLPSWQTTTVTRRQAWNIGPDNGHPWTVLDDLPKPTDLKAGPLLGPTAYPRRSCPATSAEIMTACEKARAEQL